MPLFLQPGFRGSSPALLHSRNQTRLRRASAADSHGLHTESETSTGPRRAPLAANALLGATEPLSQLLATAGGGGEDGVDMLPDLAMPGTEHFGTENFSLAMEVAGQTQTQGLLILEGQHDSFG